mmetsp:Transcript_120105/g.339876  ORF Transcript_120105/g.339876 Transcript_120105/m.339876 type:complete len:697 (-) Transcript_120105:163-2253(-)
MSVFRQYSALVEVPRHADSERLSGHIVYKRKHLLQHGKVPLTCHHFWPPRHLPLDLLFFRHFFERLIKLGPATKDRGIHVTQLACGMMRLMDLLDMDGLDVHNNLLMEALPQSPWVQWDDFRAVLKDEGFPEVRLHWSERLFMTLDDPVSSDIARALSVFTTIVILLNVILIVVQTLPDLCERIAGVVGCELQRHGSCGSNLEIFFCVVFTLDYVTKAVLVAGVRMDVLSRETILTQAVPNANNRQDVFNDRARRSPVKRVAIFASQGINIVDLISILPFWSKIIFGTLLPPTSTSFLRALRITRIFRIMKTGKYLQTLKTLATTLARSASSVWVLLMYILMTSLIAGVILQQVEQNEYFSSVPQASWWVFIRLISAQHSAPWAEGRPESWVGAFVLSCIMCYKGVLWILPFGQIGTAFRQTWSEVEINDEFKTELAGAEASDRIDAWHQPGCSVTAHLEVWPACLPVLRDCDVENPQKPFEPPSIDVLTGCRDDHAYGTASLPVPILRAQATETTRPLSVPITKGYLHPWFQEPPVVELGGTWEPSEEMQRSGCPTSPSGSLVLKPIRGLNFPVHMDNVWVVRISVKTTQSSRPVEYLEMISKTGGAEPEWGEPFRFNVNWRHDTTSPSLEKAAASKVAPHESPKGNECDVSRRVFELLEAQQTQLKRQGQLLEEQATKLAALQKAFVDRGIQLE